MRQVQLDTVDPIIHAGLYTRSQQGSSYQVVNLDVDYSDR